MTKFIDWFNDRAERLGETNPILTTLFMLITSIISVAIVVWLSSLIGNFYSAIIFGGGGVAFVIIRWLYLAINLKDPVDKKSEYDILNSSKDTKGK